jgi:hypothetical protein
MIIYGARAKQLATQTVSAQCSGCSHETQVLVAHQRYAHVYWIPLFPMNKVVSAVCAKCQKLTAEKEFPANLQMHGGPFRSTLSTPKWMFVGLVLIACGIGAGVYSANHDKQAKIAHLAKPHIGDVYVFYDLGGADDKYHYSFGRLVDVNDSEATFVLGKYRYNLSSGVKREDTANPESYDEERVAIPRNELTEKLVSDIYPGDGPVEAKAGESI